LNGGSKSFARIAAASPSRISDPANAPAATLVHCGRCNAARGTVENLHDLARRGTELFEF
jgi:hypothetical protein